MFCYFQYTSLSFNIKLKLCAGIHSLLLWTVNPAYFELIAHLNYFDIDEHSQTAILGGGTVKVTALLQNIYFCVSQIKASHAGLQWHKSEKIMPGQFFGCTVSLNLSLLRLSKDQLFENCSVIPKEGSIIYRFHMLSLQLGRWCCPRCIYSWSSCRYPAVGARHLRLTVTSQEAAGHLLYAAFTWESLKQPVGNQKHTHTHTGRESLIRHLLQLLTAEEWPLPNAVDSDVHTRSTRHRSFRNESSFQPAWCRCHTFD